MISNTTLSLTDQCVVAAPVCKTNIDINCDSSSGGDGGELA